MSVLNLPRSAVDPATAGAAARAPARPVVLPTMLRDGDCWTVVYRGRLSRLRHGKGMAYLAQLLARPGDCLHVSELCARGLPDHAESARKAVTSRIRSAIADVGRRDPSLGAHLAAAVSTGTLCRYEPGRGSAPGSRED